MKTQLLNYSLLASCLMIVSPSNATQTEEDRQMVERGRYLTVVGACHDCHTPGYPEAAGKIAREYWLTGNIVGFPGGWGTSYPANLRLFVQQIDEKQWLQRVREEMRPPMPWFNLRDMTDEDLRAIYRYLLDLGPAGKPAPKAVPPGVAVTTPFYDFSVRNLPKQAMK